MKDAVAADPASADPAPDRRWVWWSSDDSVAKGKLSVLAVAEIPVAMMIFWGIGVISPWPWLTVIGLMAAPLLLLRSPESIAAGLASFQAYFLPREVSLSVKLVAFSLAAILAFGGGYALATHFLRDLTGPMKYASGGALGVLPFLITYSLGPALNAKEFHSISTRILAVSATGLVLAIGLAANMGLAVTPLVGMLLMICLFLLKPFDEMLATILVMPSLVAGVSVRVTVTRLWNTVKHLHRGLICFSSNWRETVCCVDLVHPPELFPRVAGEISPRLRFQWSVFNLRKVRAEGGDWFTCLTLLVSALLLYLPAILYRWNIKASAPIWGLLAFALRPANWLDDEHMRTRTSFWTTPAMQRGIGLMFLLLALWLGFAAVPADWARFVPTQIKDIHALLPPPPFGLRYLMLCASVAAMAFLWFFSYSMRAAHAKALEGAGDYHNYPEHLKLRFKQMAEPVRVLLQCNVALLASTIWVFALWWALQRWPNELQHVVWVWLRPWL